jgi:hypothetical protein
MRTFSRGCGALALAGLLAATGCLRKELTHTIYVSPTAVTWTALEKDVRSDDSDPGKRMLEEQDYILGAGGGQHPIARALYTLGATRIETTLLRRERPFTVMTTGQFTDLADLAAAIIKIAGVRGEATIERNGCEKTFRAWIDASNGGAEPDALSELMRDAISYRLVLTEGRFVRGEGFTIDEDGAVATIGTPAEVEEDIVRVSLTWTEAWCAPSNVSR